MVRRQAICKYESNYYTVPLLRNNERTAFCYEDNSEKSTTLSRIFYEKTRLFINQKSTLTAYTMAPISSLARNFLPAAL